MSFVTSGKLLQIWIGIYNSSVALRNCGAILISYDVTLNAQFLISAASSFY